MYDLLAPSPGIKLQHWSPVSLAQLDELYEGLALRIRREKTTEVETQTATARAHASVSALPHTVTTTADLALLPNWAQRLVTSS